MSTTERSGDRTTTERGRALVEAVGRHDLDALRAAWDETSTDDFVALDLVVRGPEALTAFFSELFAAVPDLAMEVQDAFGTGERAVVRWRLTGTFTGGPFQGIDATGRSLDLRGVDVMEFQGEILRHNTVYYDGATWAREIGMLPALRSPADRALIRVFNATTAARRRLKRG
jgi:steroid delta-isomerase-like uncharacterized protein